MQKLSLAKPILPDINNYNRKDAGILKLAKLEHHPLIYNKKNEMRPPGKLPNTPKL